MLINSEVIPAPPAVPAAVNLQDGSSPVWNFPLHLSPDVGSQNLPRASILGVSFFHLFNYSLLLSLLSPYSPAVSCSSSWVSVKILLGAWCYTACSTPPTAPPPDAQTLGHELACTHLDNFAPATWKPEKKKLGNVTELRECSLQWEKTQKALK